MIKLIFSKVEDINKAATFPEKNFIIVIDLGICCYLSIVRTFRKLENFWTQTSRFNCIENFGGKNSAEIYFITEKNLSQGILPDRFPGSSAFTLNYSLIFATCAVSSTFLGFLS